MSSPAPRRYWLFGCLCVMIIASGCFQAVGSETTPIAQALPSDTPIPSPTDLPTLPPTESPTPEEDIEPTSDLAFPTVPVVPTSSPTNAPQVAQQPTIDEFALSATAFLLQRTLEFEATQTEIARQSGIQPPVATPTLFGEVPSFGTTPTVFQQPPLPGTDCVHEVRPAEPNLFRISLLYGVSVNDIAARNGIANINLIYFGDRLIIPGCGTTGVIPLATSTDVPVAAQDAGVGGSTIGTTSTGTVTSTGGQIHIVQQYESLFEISLRYGVSVNDIAARNGITNVNLIYMGQELSIP